VLCNSVARAAAQFHTRAAVMRVGSPMHLAVHCIRGSTAHCLLAGEEAAGGRGSGLVCIGTGLPGASG